MKIIESAHVEIFNVPAEWRKEHAQVYPWRSNPTQAIRANVLEQRIVSCVDCIQVELLGTLLVKTWSIFLRR